MSASFKYGQGFTFKQGLSALEIAEAETLFVLPIHIIDQLFFQHLNLTEFLVATSSVRWKRAVRL